MCDRAWEWAARTGNLRTNQVHGEEEIKIVLNETFLAKNIHREENERSGSIQVEDICMHEFVSYPSFLAQDPSGSLLTSELPDMLASTQSFLEQMAGEQAAAQKPSELGNTAAISTFKLLISTVCSNVASILRMVFPTLAANQSPFSILPKFVDVVGKKVKKMTEEKAGISIGPTSWSVLQDRLDAIGTAAAKTQPGVIETHHMSPAKVRKDAGRGPRQVQCEHGKAHRVPHGCHGPSRED